MILNCRKIEEDIQAGNAASAFQEEVMLPYLPLKEEHEVSVSGHAISNEHVSTHNHALRHEATAWSGRLKLQLYSTKRKDI